MGRRMRFCRFRSRVRNSRSAPRRSNALTDRLSVAALALSSRYSGSGMSTVVLTLHVYHIYGTDASHRFDAGARGSAYRSESASARVSASGSLVGGWQEFPTHTSARGVPL